MALHLSSVASRQTSLDFFTPFFSHTDTLHSAQAMALHLSSVASRQTSLDFFSQDLFTPTSQQRASLLSYSTTSQKEMSLQKSPSRVEEEKEARRRMEKARRENLIKLMMELERLM